MANQNLNIVVIGAGNLATHLAYQLQSSKYCIVQIYSRSESSALALSLKLNAPYTTDIASIKTNADIYFFAVKDSALPSLLEKMPSSKGLFVHTAGSVPMNIFKSYTSSYGVFYPLQTFSKNRDVDFTKIPVCIEASGKEELQLLHKIGSDLSEKVLEINSEQRETLHLSAVFAANFTNHMYALAEQILNDAKINFDILHPLIEECSSKAQVMKPILAQTGPAKRYDKSIIDHHITKLSGHPELQHLYLKISESIHHLNIKNNG